MEDALWRPDTSGEAGPLLPRYVYDQLPMLGGGFSNAQLHAAFRVVGLRIDPCFPGNVPEAQCRRQIRMVWQPIREGNQGMVGTVDVALHTFHDLTPSEFSKLTTALLKLKHDAGVSTQGRPLGVHPALAQQGLAGAYMNGLARVILSLAGERNLTRITFMQLMAAGMLWEFGGFDITAPGKLEAMRVARVDAFSQDYKNGSMPPVQFLNGGATPEPKGTDTINMIIRDSRPIKPHHGPQISEEVKSAFRIENPRIHTPDTVDCVSCHIAQPARLWAIKAFADLNLEQQHQAWIYRAKGYDLTNTSTRPAQTNIMHGLGYFGTMVAVSQRTINESAEVAQALNRALK